MTTALGQMKNISKSYGRVHALENIHLTVNEREIVSLLGDNGLICVVAADIDPKATTVAEVEQVITGMA